MADPSPPGDDRAFLGRGWSFPPTFDRKVGGVQMLEHEDDIASSLHILLSTARGERIMVPQYGCNMDELVFENLDMVSAIAGHRPPAQRRPAPGRRRPGGRPLVPCGQCRPRPGAVR